MRALTLTQPWASLMAHGEKRVETRSWWPPATLPRGEWIAIHAAKGLGPVGGKDGLAAMCERYPFHRALLDAGYTTVERPGLPHDRDELDLDKLMAECGHVLAVACFDRGLMTEYAMGEIRGGYPPRELVFGDYSRGRVAWIFSAVERLPDPVKTRGNRRVFELPRGVSARIAEVAGRRVA